MFFAAAADAATRYVHTLTVISGNMGTPSAKVNNHCWYLLLKSSFHYRPQTKFVKVMFLQVSVCPQGERAWLLPGGGCVWLLWGACMVARGGACVVAPGGCAWLSQGVCGCSWGVMHGCSRGVHGCSGGHAWDMTRYGDTINERAVRIPSYWNAFLLIYC